MVYGVPADLPLQRFVDAELIQICIGQYQMQFVFDQAGIIAVEGGWDLRDEIGKTIDTSQPMVERDCFRVHRVIGQAVSAYEIHPPVSFVLHFANSYSLTIYDDSEQYESFSIQPGAIYV